MKSLFVLLLCGSLPWLSCGALKRSCIDDEADEPWAQERALARYRRLYLRCAMLGGALAAAAGGWAAAPSFMPQWPAFGAWFLSSLSLLVANVSFVLLGRTNEEIREMPEWEAVRRSIRLCALPIVGAGLSIPLLTRLGPWAGPLCVVSVLLAAPWLLLASGAWTTLNTEIRFRGRSWRIVQLPLPSPLTAHVGAVPWLRTVFVSDMLLRRLEPSEWSSLARYELSPEPGAAWPRITRWAAVLVGGSFSFSAAGLLDDPNTLVAATSLVTLSCLLAGWRANRQSSSLSGVLPNDPEAPSAEELARALRCLPPLRGQALPRTSHRPLGSELYDRLFALGYDPGPRPRS